MRILPAGPSAVLVEVDSLDAVFALADEVGRRRCEGWRPELIDVVPGARTLLLDGAGDPAGVAAEIRDWHLETAPTVEPEEMCVPCRYDGPDLEAVARHWAVPVDEIAAIHSGLAHRVAFCGFSPGFAYIDGLGDRWRVPRRPSPRPTVDAGSVGLAGGFTGVYPRPSPGGWQLIGHTDVVLWNLDSAPAATLAPGTRVRFVPA